MDRMCVHGFSDILTMGPNRQGLVKLIGHHMNLVSSVLFTKSEISCESDVGPPISTFQTQVSDVLAFLMIFPEVEITYHICLTSEPMGRLADNDNDTTGGQFQHQGVQPYRSLRVKLPVRHYLMPLPIQIIIIVVLVMLSSLFSGLNLGLMSLNKTELQIISKVRETKQRCFD